MTRTLACAHNAHVGETQWIEGVIGGCPCATLPIAHPVAPNCGCHRRCRSWSFCAPHVEACRGARVSCAWCGARSIVQCPIFHASRSPQFLQESANGRPAWVREAIAVIKRWSSGRGRCRRDRRRCRGRLGRCASRLPSWHVCWRRRWSSGRYPRRGLCRRSRWRSRWVRGRCRGRTGGGLRRRQRCRLFRWILARCSSWQRGRVSCRLICWLRCRHKCGCFGWER